MLVLTVAIDLDKLLQDGRVTATAFLGEMSRVVVMTIDLPLVFVVAVGGAKHGRTHGAGEVLDVILSLKGGDV